MKFLAVVVACGLYQGHNDICLTWTDQSWYSSREQCIARGQEIAKSVKTLTWYARVELARSPSISCKEKQ